MFGTDGTATRITRRGLAGGTARGAVGVGGAWALAACGMGSAGSSGGEAAPTRPAALAGKIQVAYRTDTLS
ncbi:MAG TPA: hypothetical protein VFN74_19935, partial [Chloroflexota bacterium]|nr:hypothetical protein [Chloroflexota bacterium]